MNFINKYPLVILNYPNLRDDKTNLEVPFLLLNLNRLNYPAITHKHKVLNSSFALTFKILLAKHIF
jgi:hypothetical protein